MEIRHCWRQRRLCKTALYQLGCPQGCDSSCGLERGWHSRNGGPLHIRKEAPRKVQIRSELRLSGKWTGELSAIA